MQENQIAESLKANIPAPDPVVAPVADEPVAPGASALDSSVALDDGLLMQSVVQNLGLLPQASLNPDINDKLKLVIKFAADEAGTSDREAVLSIIDRYASALGITYHENKFSKLYAFIKTRTYLNDVGL
jgi:hypothetical protein